MHLEIVEGIKRHKLELPDHCFCADKDAKHEPKNETAESSEAKNEVWTVFKLKQEIEKLCGIPVENQKIIHRGRSAFENDLLLSKLNLKPGEKMMVLGKKAEPEFDPILSSFKNIENSEVKSLTEKTELIKDAIANLEKGFLPEAQKPEQQRTLEKKLKGLHEEAMRTLELLDSMNLGENPTDLYRAKRKELVVAVQKCLTEHDNLEDKLRQLDDNKRH